MHGNVKATAVGHASDKICLPCKSDISGSGGSWMVVEERIHALLARVFVAS